MVDITLLVVDLLERFDSFQIQPEIYTQVGKLVSRLSVKQCTIGGSNPPLGAILYPLGELAITLVCPTGVARSILAVGAIYCTSSSIGRALGFYPIGCGIVALGVHHFIVSSYKGYYLGI